MAQHNHLSLKRLEGELQRRKHGFGGGPRRDSKPHGAGLQAELESIIAAQRMRPKIADINPSLIVKVRTVAPIDEQDWARLSLTVLASDPDKTLILFATDDELQEFRRRVAAYQQDPPAGQKHPEYAGFVGAIEEIGEILPADRIGQILRSEGVLSPDDFVADERQVLDVELWQPSAEQALLFTHRVATRLKEFGGVVVNEYRGDSATLMRVEGNGAAMRAILELPEVAIIDRPPQPDWPDMPVGILTIADLPAVVAPVAGAASIGIIDSGITGAHPLLAGVIAGAFGVPAALGDNDGKGHGTPVSGIAVYGDVRQRLASKNLNARFRVVSARVVNDKGRFDDEQLVASQMETAIRRLTNEFGCKVINISLADKLRPVGAKPSAWAAVLDQLARELDLVIVVSAGNSDGTIFHEHGDAIVDAYPNYLLDERNRILEPASAINILTVGSIAHTNGLAPEDGSLVGVRPLAERDQPSPFTRVGPGVGRIMKPDLVDYGGTAVFDGATQTVVGAASRASAGVLSLHNLYLDRLFTSQAGTSFASPLVAYKAALIREAFPQATSNLVRALLAICAEPPQAALECLAGFDDETVMNVIGYGVPNVDHALASDDSRVILYREDVLNVDRFAVYEIPIPKLFQTENGSRQIRVSLSFDPPVRHSRSDYAGLSMGFRLIRGANEREVFEAFRKWEKSEGAPFRLAGRLQCSLKPGPQRRERGTLQCASFTAKQNIETYGDRYFLAVMCEGGWAAASVGTQRFAVAVELRHEADIPLYQLVQERVRVRA
jgi:subtilisin family serine protease